MTSFKLLTLPAELLLSIAQHLAGPALSKLSRTCHFLHHLLASPLDKLFVLNAENMSLWATLSNQAGHMRRCLDLGALFPDMMILHQLALPGYHETTGVALEDGAGAGEGGVVASTSLLRAVRGGDVQAVRALVETDIVRRTFKPVRERATLIARARGDKEIEALLLSSGA